MIIDGFALLSFTTVTALKLFLVGQHREPNVAIARTLKCRRGVNANAIGGSSGLRHIQTLVKTAR
jgi:hypothetical protein